jgi:6-pyruvoyltetrahydropterin/6-carboxytetrahydropterin synthase
VNDARTPDRLIITKRFSFEASHVLDHHDGKCARLHGHSYKLEISLIGDVQGVDAANPSSGMVLDFADVTRHVKPFVDEYLDHRHLNDSLPIEYTTAEMILRWIVDNLFEWFGVMLYEVTLWETETSSATWKKHLHG